MGKESLNKAKEESYFSTLKGKCAPDPLTDKFVEESKADTFALNSMGIELAQFLDSSPVPTFVIDSNHVITHWNKACEFVLGYSAASMLFTRNHWKAFYRDNRPVLADLVLSGDDIVIKKYYENNFSSSQLIPGAYEAVDFFPDLQESGLWLHFTAAPLYNKEGVIVGAIETVEDITQRCDAEKALRQAHDSLENLVKSRTLQLADTNKKLELDIRQRTAVENELLRRNTELTELNAKLSVAQEQLLQAEKLASIGQLAAGVAHEINNPIGYIFSNFTTLEHYIKSLFSIIQTYETAELHISAPDIRNKLEQIKDERELSFLKEDIPALVQQSLEGIERVRKIVQDLKDFSRIDSHDEWQWTNIHQGIESTLNIVSNEIKYKADVIKEFGELPDIECIASQLNQVIMNLVLNASHAMETKRGTLIIRTKCDGSYATIEVRDNGVGIPKENIHRIFDPFFTTKPIGKGTGLGLSLSYGIIQKHKGNISVTSEIGKGSSFLITLPIRHTYDSLNEEGSTK